MHNDGFFVNDPNFKGSLRQSGAHHNYITTEIEAFWKDTVKDGNQPYSLLWIERKNTPEPTNPVLDDMQRGINAFKAYRDTREQGPEGNWEGYANVLIGHDRDYPRLEHDLKVAQTTIKENISQRKVLNDTIVDLDKLLEEAKEALKECQTTIVEPVVVEDPNWSIKNIPTKLLVREVMDRILSFRGGESNGSS